LALKSEYPRADPIKNLQSRVDAPERHVSSILFVATVAVLVLHNNNNNNNSYSYNNNALYKRNNISLFLLH
jgi:hypothetical protein